MVEKIEDKLLAFLKLQLILTTGLVFISLGSVILLLVLVLILTK